MQTTFKPAELHKNKSWEIVYYAFDPKKNGLKRVRIRLNHIKDKRERLKYAKFLINKINTKLYSGWNPFINPEKQKQYTKLSEAVEHFLAFSRKRLKEGLIRQNSYKDYNSNINTFLKWAGQELFVYEFDKPLILRFLDYIFVGRDLTAQTHNNYLNNLRVFSGFLVQKGYLKNRPTEGISNIKANNKRRKIITATHLKEIFDYLKYENTSLYVAANMLYYTFIRPIEMTNLKIKDLDYKKGLIHLNREYTKNKRDAAVTIPGTLLKILIDAKIHEYPNNYYIFSKDLQPGKVQIHPKTFRAGWKVACRALKMPEEYQFYSLKDTGITDMMRKTRDPLAVRNQARHYSLDVTAIYTDREIREADETIKGL